MTEFDVSRRTIGTVEVTGSKNWGNALCAKCDEGISPLGMGSWEEAQRWAMRHECKGDAANG